MDKQKNADVRATGRRGRDECLKCLKRSLPGSSPWRPFLFRRIPNMEAAASTGSGTVQVKIGSSFFRFVFVEVVCSECQMPARHTCWKCVELRR